MNNGALPNSQMFPEPKVVDYITEDTPDPLYIESWRLAVQIVCFGRASSTTDAYCKIALEEWQVYFLERLKGGTDGK